MFDEVLFGDSLRRLDGWALVGAVLFVKLLDQISTRTRDIKCQRAMSDMASSTFESTT
jgi:hypothetical protein